MDKKPDPKLPHSPGEIAAVDEWFQQNLPELEKRYRIVRKPPILIITSLEQDKSAKKKG